MIVGLGSGGSSTGATEGFGDFFGDAVGDFFPFFFFDVLDDALAFFFFDGVGVTSSSDCATLFGFFASGVSLGFALGFGEGVLLLDFRFLGVDFRLGGAATTSYSHSLYPPVVAIVRVATSPPCLISTENSPASRATSASFSGARRRITRSSRTYREEW